MSNYIMSIFIRTLLNLAGTKCAEHMTDGIGCQLSATFQALSYISATKGCTGFILVAFGSPTKSRFTH